MEEEIIKKHGLQVTPLRRKVVSLLEGAKTALSHNDIMDQLHNEFDRVSVYRTLNTFAGKDMVHKIIGDDQISRYVLISKPGTATVKDTAHIHFQCKNCGKLCCMEDVKTGPFKLPGGYVVLESNFLLIGICDECNQK